MACKTAVVIASGPSLTAEDCALVEASGLFTIAVNTSWKVARFCDVIYAADAAWWDAYGHEIDIPARRVCHMRQSALRHGIEHSGASQSVLNSGMRAAQWAMRQGFKRIILLGFDCSVDHGTHWHGDHQKTKNPTRAKAREWIGHFAALANEASAVGVEIVNCSRHTELTCFPLQDLECAIESFDSHMAVAR